MNRAICPICNLQLVEAAGPVDSEVLVFGEYPGHKETIEGKPFVGAAGSVLKTELVRVGLQLHRFRYTNLWKHAKPNPKEDNYQEHLDWHLKELLRELKGRRFALMMGSDCAKVFGLPSIMSVSGLAVENFLFGDTVVVASPNPALALHDKIGEVRLAITRFKEKLDEQL